MKDAKDDVKDVVRETTLKPLRLSRETLRELDDFELEQVAGGKHKETHSCNGKCGGGGSRHCTI